MKSKQGSIDRILDNQTIIVKDLFKPDTKSDLFIKKPVEINGIQGVILSTFGKSGKIKCAFKSDIYLDSEGNLQENIMDQPILFRYKKQYNIH